MEKHTNDLYTYQFLLAQNQATDFAQLIFLFLGLCKQKDIFIRG